MRTRCLSVLFVVSVVATGLIFVTAPTVSTGEEAQIPREVLEQFRGQRMPSMEELESSGLLARIPDARTASVSPRAELGFLTEWHSHGRCLIGNINNDLINEASMRAPCTTDYKFTDHDDSPYLSRYTWNYSEGYINTYSSQAYWDSPNCRNIWENQVRYFVTQVWSGHQRQPRIHIGADDNIRVWLNGQVILNESGTAEYQEGQYSRVVTLTQGWNLIVVKVAYAMLGPTDHPDYEQKYWSMRFTLNDGVTPLHLPQAYDGWCEPTEGRYGWVYWSGVADLGGAHGSRWQSRLQVANPWHIPRRLTFEYYQEQGVGSAVDGPPATQRTTAGPDATRIVVLEPYSTMVWENVLQEMGVPAGQKGMLALNGFYYYDPWYNDLARMTTFNNASTGTFGMKVPPAYLYSGDSCCSRMLSGLRNGPGYRTNIQCMPMGTFDDEVSFTVEVYNPASGAITSRNFTGRGYFQVNDIYGALGLGSMVTDDGIIYVRWDRTDNRAYLDFTATVNDNGTSDPDFIGESIWWEPLPLQ